MISCRSVALKFAPAEKGARFSGGDCNTSETAAGVANVFESGDVGLFAASSLNDGDKGSRFESRCLDMDFLRFS